MNTITNTSPLLLSHHREHLHQSGLTDETIQAAGIYSVTDTAKAGELLGWNGPGPAPAIALLYFDMDGAVTSTVLRPDNPVQRKDGSKPKYESPQGAEPRLYFTPEALVPADKWRDRSQPIIVVEGIKKALAAVQAGVPAISAQGTTVWHDIKYREETDQWRLHSDFNRIPLKDRTVFIAFDGGDTTHNPHVILAEARLASMLLDAGADVQLLRIPAQGTAKVGLDDYLARQQDPKEALKSLLVEAVPGEVLKRLFALADVEPPADRRMAGLQLLRDKSIIAALYIAPQDVKDVFLAETRAIIGASKGAVEEKIAEFKALFSTGESGDPEDRAVADPEIVEEAEELLTRPDLVPRLLAHFKKEGLVGEEAAAETVLLAGVSRHLPKPLNLVVKAASSSGKNHVVGTVVRGFPLKNVKEITEMSPKALQYLQEGIRHKIIVIAEDEGSQRAAYSMRSIQSEGRLKVLVAEKNEDGRVETREHVVEGPACFITTTTRLKGHDENETRQMEVLLDESEEQTDRILKAQARMAAHPPTASEVERLERERTVIQTALGLLRSYPVRIPQAEKMREGFPTRDIRRRRDFSKLLTLASAHALVHQRQREIDSGMVVAADDDIRAAERLFASLRSTTSPRLNALAEKLREEFREDTFTPKQAAQRLGQDTDALRKRLNELLKAELVEIVEQNRGNKPATWRVMPDCPTLSGTTTCQTELLENTDESTLSDCAKLLRNRAQQSQDENHYPTAQANPTGPVLTDGQGNKAIQIKVLHPEKPDAGQHRTTGLTDETTN